MIANVRTMNPEQDNPKTLFWKNRILLSIVITIAIEALFVYVKYGKIFRSYDFTLGLELVFTFLYFLSLFWIYSKISQLFHSPIFKNFKILYINFIEGIVVILGTTVLTVIMKLLPLWIIMIVVNAQKANLNLAFDWNSVRQNIILHAIIALFIYYFVERERIKKNLTKQHLNNAKIQEEYMEWQLRTLKNQVNPAFLFDTLDVLDELVKKDEERSVELVNRLSHLYRKLLEHKEQLVELKTELELIEAYNQLLQVKFGSRSFFQNNSLETFNNWLLPPGALYKIAECYIEDGKNLLTEDPHVLISTEKNSVILSGPLRNTEFLMEVLDHLRNSYTSFTDRSVIIEEKEQYLHIQLPLLPPLTS